MSSDNLSLAPSNERSNERLRRPTLRALHAPTISTQRTSTTISPRKSTVLPPSRKPSHAASMTGRRYSKDYQGPLDHRSRSSSTVLHAHVELENTYKLAPDAKFSAAAAEKVIKDVLEKHLSQLTYDGETMGDKARILSDVIRERVKEKKYARYKIVSWVMICEKRKNNMRVASRGLWDETCDNSASYTFEAPTFYAIGNVFAVYQE